MVITSYLISLIINLSLLIFLESYGLIPYPFAKYLTSSMFNAPSQLWEWGMTTNILGEFVANFSFVEILIASFLLLYIINKVNSVKNLWFKLFLYPIVKLS